ncbi:transposase [Bradyrhizobium liaoningense]|uniref:Transposase n=1 Tax=Bradyrhizobium barranii subsp. barranii TaxID=2823807 RepID=A0A939M4K9_9BRAD|nr:transposase [Bradyrhizobium liaoningense]MBR0948422.1 transposase [Bradyrhizobium liaoningense]MBR1004509.1 transposase [Bradyrhizobium liaoningense]MBR1034170.1 transposase [Bradyrhizobium liaoningense]MBR1071023.1 transposase [Bradyrhizobium liaoningense]
MGCETGPWPTSRTGWPPARLARTYRHDQGREQSGRDREFVDVAPCGRRRRRIQGSSQKATARISTGARNQVERYFNRVEQCRRVATRYDTSLKAATDALSPRKQREPETTQAPAPLSLGSERRQCLQ